MTRNTGKAQCAHTADPCNKVPPSPTSRQRRKFATGPREWVADDEAIACLFTNKKECCDLIQPSFLHFVLLIGIAAEPVALKGGVVA
jgi:hypothetical protein